MRRGQQVFYVTERAVFRRTANHDVIELIEIAEGVDVQKDIVDQMDFTPVISPELKTMDPRIFMEPKMNVTTELFGSLEERCSYHKGGEFYLPSYVNGDTLIFTIVLTHFQPVLPSHSRSHDVPGSLWHQSQYS